MRAWIGGLLLAFSATTALAASPVRDLRLLTAADGARLVIDLGPQAPYHVFTLSNPDRVVIDLPASSKPSRLPALQPGGLIRDLRTGHRDGGLRIVLDTAKPLDPTTFSLSPADGYGYRVVVDLASAGPEAAPSLAVPATPAPAATGNEHATVTAAASPARPSVPAVRQGTTVELRQKPIVIAIDAGHGGIDPGAHGPDGLEEKTVTLAVARKLAALVDDQPGMKAYLTRHGDYFVDLRQRMVLAREAQADLFVSIHCNAVRNSTARGTAVYVLSDHGATNEQARWLANRENSADLVGGVNLQDKDNQVAAVLLDISQTATMEASFDLAGRLLKSLSRINPLQREQVQQAGFMVLKSPDIPSVLVETAFITNPHEERLLGSSSYQQRLAQSLLDGIEGYFSNYRPLQQVVVHTPPRGRVRSEPVRLAHHSGGTSSAAAKSTLLADD